MPKTKLTKAQEKKCKHDWAFDYQEFYDGVRPGYYQDMFHCKKCLERKPVKVNEFHHIRK